MNNNFCQEWGNTYSAMIFRSEEVSGENYCQIASQVTEIIDRDPYIILLHYLANTKKTLKNHWLPSSPGTVFTD